MKLMAACAALLICSLPAFAADRCGPVKQSTLLLPSDQIFVRKYFIDKAKQLNDAGRCVVGGGFDRTTKLFYYRVNDTDDPRLITVLRYSFAELSNRNINR